MVCAQSDQSRTLKHDNTTHDAISLTKEIFSFLGILTIFGHFPKLIFFDLHPVIIIILPKA